MTRRAATILLLLCTLVPLAGCGDDPLPPSHVLPTGDFSYRMSGTHLGVEYEFAGTLTITTANSDAVTGTWDVLALQGTTAPGYEKELAGGQWDGEAYVVEASYEGPGESGTVVHRIALVDDEPTCVSVEWNLFFEGVPAAEDPEGVTCEIEPPA